MDAKESKAFTQGFACAVAVEIQNHGDSTSVEDLIRAGGLTIAECEKNKVDDYDMVFLRPILERLER